MNFRYDILILRGYSIVIILLYHCNILIYGYNAVIIFIEISGYLSKSGIGYFSLWKRYIKLIYPSITNLFILFVIYSKDLQDEHFYYLCNVLFSTMLLYSNYYFIFCSTDYFNPPDNSLLLHYWYISVDLHLHFINLIDQVKYEHMNIIFSALSVLIYLITYIKFKSYNYFSSIPRVWEYFFPKIILYDCGNNNTKLVGIMMLMSIIIYKEEFIDERIYHQIIVFGTYFYLCNSTNVRCYLLERIGFISFFIYLVHYPIIKLEGKSYSSIMKVILYSIVLYTIYGGNGYSRIVSYKIFYIILLLVEMYGIMYYATIIPTYALDSKFDTFAIKRINRNDYCCYSILNYDKSVLFIGDSHVFNLIGNYYNILTKYQYKVYYKYIHTEFIVRNSSDLYDISDYFNLIVNMNLFYDNKHKEYIEIYPIKIEPYLLYLKSKTKYVIYFIPTPVLTGRLSCKQQKSYVAQNGVDISIYPGRIENYTEIFVFDITHLFCINNSCNLNYKGSCIYSDEHHFTYNFYKRILNYSIEIIKPYLNYIRNNNHMINNCEYTLYKNKILRAWKFPHKGCKLQLYY